MFGSEGNDFRARSRKISWQLWRVGLSSVVVGSGSMWVCAARDAEVVWRTVDCRLEGQQHAGWRSTLRCRLEEQHTQPRSGLRCPMDTVFTIHRVPCSESVYSVYPGVNLRSARAVIPAPRPEKDKESLSKNSCITSTKALWAKRSSSTACVIPGGALRVPRSRRF